MSKFWKKALAIFAVLALCLFVFAACVPEPEPDPPAPPPEEPTQEQINLENMVKFGKVLVATAALNPSEGFYVGADADLSFAFDDEAHKRYDWSYGFKLAANIFVDGRDALVVEVKDTLGEYTDAEKAAGNDVLFGLYNTQDSHLYLSVGGKKFNFENAAVSTALKAILKANGIKLDVVLTEIEISKELGSLAGLLETAMTFLASVTDKVAIDGNDYVIETSFAKIYNFVDGLMPTVTGKPGATLASLLGKDLTDKLPDDISLKLRVKTANGIITGFNVENAKLDMKDDKQNGTFNFASDLKIQKDAPADFDVATVFGAAFDGVPATKVLNLQADGKIELTKQGAAVRNLSWKLIADVDAFKLLEKNLVLTDETLKDNFFQFQLALEGSPLVDLAWGPDKLGTADVNAIIDVKAVLGLLGVNPNDATINAAIGKYPSYLLLPVTDTALAALLGGTGGAIPTPDAGSTGSGEGGGSSETTPVDIGGILDTVMKVVSAISIDGTAGTMTIRVQDIFASLGLDDSIKGTLNTVLGSADVALFSNNRAEVGLATTKDYNLAEDLLKGKDGQPREYAKAAGRDLPKIAGLLQKEFETHDGYLLTYVGDSDTVRLDAKGRPVSIDLLNDQIGNAKVRYHGTDILGTVWDNGKIEYQYDSITGTYYLDTVILGYLGVDPAKRNVEQEITVVTGAPDPTGWLEFTKTAGTGILGDTIERFAGIRIPNLNLAFHTFKAKVILGEVAGMKVNLYDENTGADAEVKTYTALDQFEGRFNIEATVSYKASAMFPTGYTEIVTIGAADSKNTDNAVYMTKVNAKVLTKSNKNYIGATKDFTVEGMAFGTKFNKTIRVLEPTDYRVHFNGDKNFVPVGSKLYNPYYYVRYDFVYGEQRIEGLQDKTEQEKEKPWEAENGMLDDKGYTQKTGELKTTVEMDGSVHELTMYAVESLDASVADVENSTVTDGKFNVTGTLNVTGASFPSGVDRAVNVAVTLKSYKDTAWTLTSVRNLVLTTAGNETNADNKVTVTLPEDLSNGFSIPFTITGVPSATAQYILQLDVTSDTMATSGKLAFTGSVPFENEAVNFASKAFAANANLGTTSGTSKVRLALKNIGYYYIRWSTDRYLFRLDGDSVAYGNDLEAVVEFRNNAGELVPGYNAEDGKLLSGISGTYRIYAKDYPAVYVEVSVTL